MTKDDLLSGYRRALSPRPAYSAVVAEPNGETYVFYNGNARGKTGFGYAVLDDGYHPPQWESRSAKDGCERWREARRSRRSAVSGAPSTSR